MVQYYVSCHCCCAGHFIIQTSPVPSGCHPRKAGELEGLIQCMSSFSDAGIPDQSVLTNKFDFLMKFLDDHAGSTWNIWWK